MKMTKWLLWTCGFAAIAAFPALILWLISTTPPVSYALDDLPWILLLVLPAVLIAWSTFPASNTRRSHRRVLFVIGIAIWGLQASGPEGAQGLLYVIAGGAGIVLMLTGGLLRESLPGEPDS